MFGNTFCLKFLPLLIVILCEIHGNKANYASNCKQRKPYAFCGAKTVVGTQWYYDLRKDKCMPFKYCLNAEEIDIKRTSLENRFTSELQCEYLCHKKKHIKTSKTMTDKLNQMLLKRLKKTISVHYQQRNSLQVQSFSQFEMKDPSRCKRQKSYSFCGSHTTPHVHWYYNKRLNRCQPYTFCEVVDYKPLVNTENNFYSETECNSLCYR